MSQFENSSRHSKFETASKNSRQAKIYENTRQETTSRNGRPDTHRSRKSSKKSKRSNALKRMQTRVSEVFLEDESGRVIPPPQPKAFQKPGGFGPGGIIGAVDEETDG
jgi:hypothetical protein